MFFEKMILKIFFYLHLFSGLFRYSTENWVQVQTVMVQKEFASNLEDKPNNMGYVQLEPVWTVSSCNSICSFVIPYKT